MIEIRFDKTKNEVALLIWFLVDHSVLNEHNKQVRSAGGRDFSPLRIHQSCAKLFLSRCTENYLYEGSFGNGRWKE
jgi:hypothetical protein